MGPIRFQFVRFAAAYIAAAIATIIARLRHHVHVDPNHLATLANLFHHKCGMLLVVCLGWFWYEAVLLFVVVARRYRVLSW